MSAVPIDRWGEQGPTFNRAAAEAVYKAMTSMDADEALVFGRILVGDAAAHTMRAYRVELHAAIDGEVRKRLDATKQGMARSAVSKARAGQDNLAELAALTALVELEQEPIGKDFDSDERRDAYGRWTRVAQDSVRIFHDPSMKKPINNTHATNLGIAEVPNHLEGEDAAHFQQAYHQLARLVAPYQHLGGAAGKHGALLHLSVQDAAGNLHDKTLAIPGRGAGLPDLGLARGERVRSATVSTLTPTGVGGAIYDAFDAVGAPRIGATLGGMTEGGVLDPDRLHAYREARVDGQQQDEYIPSQRAFRSLAQGSKLIGDSLGPTAPRQVQFALAVADHVGKLGPEAQKVIGPSADKAAYRYRGTERPVQPALGNALESIRANPMLKGGRSKREYMLHGQVMPDAEWAPSGVLAYFRRQLPSVDLNTLQLKSGHVPPSRGIIIDAHGHAVHESVGFGDDHYLPFNLKNLKALRGGEYIRTRTYGGPTTEDLYTGLVSGAHAFTVVSHNGVYTVDFNDALRGGRRFNDKALRMTARYGQLLDAVQSGQVELAGIHPSRDAELQQAAADRFDPDDETEKYKAELERLRGRERKHPTLSHEQQTEASLGFFNAWAEKTGAGVDQDGNESIVTNPDELVDRFAGIAGNRKRTAALEAIRNQQGPGAYRMAVNDPAYSIDAFKKREMTELADDDPVTAARNVANALGQGHQLDRFLDNAARDNERALQPLRLNGEGYKIALDALQEQFPYYIDRVEFHPWQGAPGRSVEDSGYVKPRHNRPHLALAGYFDRSIARDGSTGKVHADSIRWQNGRLKPAAADAGTKTKAPEDSAPKGTGKDGEKAKAGEAPKTGAGAAREAELRAKADRAMAGALLDAPADPAKVELGRYRDTPMREIANAKDFDKDYPQFAALFNLSPAALDEMQYEEPEKLHRIVAAAHREVQSDFRPKVRLEVQRDFDMGGKAPKAKEISDNPIEDIKGNIDRDWDLKDDGPRRIFGADAEPDPGDVARAYAADPSIQKLIKAGELPADPGDNDFRSALDTLHGDLRSRREAILSANLDDTALQRNFDKLNPKAKALIHAVAYRRKFDQANGRLVQGDLRADAAKNAREVRDQPLVIDAPPELHVAGHAIDPDNPVASVAAALQAWQAEQKKAGDD